MKLLRVGAVGAEKAAAIDAEGKVRDLSLFVPDFTPEWLSPVRLRALAAIDLKQMPLVPEGTRIGAPLSGIGQFIAIGLNYRRHAEESGLPIPAEPIVFNKAITSICGPNDDIHMPEASEQTDWEIELGIVIGTRASQVSVEKALDYVAGYCLANDVSERHWQLQRNGQWGKGKSFDSFGPIGPWLVTTDEIPDPQVLEMELCVNGKTRQHSNTSDMIFSAAQIVSYLSQFMTLTPGDVIITGTPSGVGLGMKPPTFLQKGDVVTLRIDQLGTQTQRVI